MRSERRGNAEEPLPRGSEHRCRRLRISRETVNIPETFPSEQLSETRISDLTVLRKLKDDAISQDVAFRRYSSKNGVSKFSFWQRKIKFRNICEILLEIQRKLERCLNWREKSEFSLMKRILQTYLTPRDTVARRWIKTRPQRSRLPRYSTRLHRATRRAHTVDNVCKWKRKWKASTHFRTDVEAHAHCSPPSYYSPSCFLALPTRSSLFPPLSFDRWPRQGE